MGSLKPYTLLSFFVMFTILIVSMIAISMFIIMVKQAVAQEPVKADEEGLYPAVRKRAS